MTKSTIRYLGRMRLLRLLNEPFVNLLLMKEERYTSSELQKKLQAYETQATCLMLMKSIMRH